MKNNGVMNKLQVMAWVAGGMVLLVLMAYGRVRWMCHGHGSIEKERNEVLHRSAYLKEKLLVAPGEIINAMPRAIGEQFQGEYALYAYSMYAAALANISWQYPETKQDNIAVSDSLIQIALSPEIRRYDAMRWGEDPLLSLDGNNSHMSYLSHIAWMMCSYKRMGGDGKYDAQLDSLCSTLARRMQQAPALNLPTYPGEPIYLPDMLVTIVALRQYALVNDGKYQDVVDKWVDQARAEWIDSETGLLVSVLSEDGRQYDNSVRGSYSALNCYYLSLVDVEWARQQYGLLKKFFWKEGIISGLKEYHDCKVDFAIDYDAGPILLELSPSGTAFMTGCATLFKDLSVRKQLLLTAEEVGVSVSWQGKCHYLLANYVLVGESIMLAMRTHWAQAIV